MISYTIQGALSITFGLPLFLFSFFIRGAHLDMLTRLVDRFIFTQSLLTTAIVTACHIRLGQTSHIFEVQFMYVLMTNGIISIAAPIVTRIFYPISESKVSRSFQFWSMVTNEKKKLFNTTQSGSQHLPLKKSRCFVRLRPLLPSHRGLLRTLSFLLILSAIPLIIYYLVEMINLMDNAKISIASSCPQNLMNDDASRAIIIGVSSFFIIMSLIIHTLIFLQSTPRQPYISSTILVPSFLTALFLIMLHIYLSVFLSRVWWSRSKFGAAVGDAFEDNEWGLGQILAIFTWIPTLVDLAYFIWTAIRRRKGQSINPPLMFTPFLV